MTATEDATSTPTTPGRATAGRATAARGVVADMGTTQRLARFLAVGAVGFVVSTAVLTVLVGRGLPNFAASLLATEVAIIGNYLLHEGFTFGTRTLAWRRLGAYNLAAALGLLITAGAFDAISRATDLPLVLRNLLAVGCGTTSNFLLSARFVWGAGPAGATPPEEPVTPTPRG